MDLVEVISQFGAQGIFGCLFIYTYLSNNKNNRDREDKYIQTIDNFNDTIKDLTRVIENQGGIKK